MSLIDDTASYWGKLHVPTNVTPQSVESSSKAKLMADYREAWQRVAGEKIIEWDSPDCDLFDDDDIEPPSKSVLTKARILVQKLSEAGFPPPTGVVPDGNGGIAMERRVDNEVATFHIYRDSEIDYYVLKDCKLIFREIVSV